jgi:N-acyl-D-amino-acid deacylase
VTAFDVLVVGGEIVDGTGNPSYRAALGIRQGRLEILRGDVSAVEAATRIDATGRVVAPGFIDAHSHSDLWLFEDPHLESKIRQGVTTEVIGVDGLSYAPFQDPADRDAFMLQNGGIAGIAEQLPAWSGVGEQLAAYDGRTAVNVATLVGNTPLRVNAVGWDDIPASAAHLDAMAGMLREALDDGALGLSTGLDYPPGSYASFDELVVLARVAAEAGGLYHTHVRYGLGDGFLDPFREAVDISRQAGLRLQITHFSKSAREERAEGAQRLLDLIDSERESGAEVTFDTYPYEWGGTRLSRLLPAWVQAGHPLRFRERLADADVRAKVAQDILDSPAVAAYRMSRPFSDLRLGNLTHPDDRAAEGRYLSELVQAADGDLAETLIALVERNPAATFTRPSPHAMTLWKFVAHRLGMIASDSVFIGHAASPRAFGCFARVLGDFVREERVLSLPEAIRKMTSLPATVLGLSGRGVIADGAHADLAIFDPATVGARAGYENPREPAVGFDHVLVGGVPVLREGEPTGATPGRGIRRQDR